MGFCYLDFNDVGVLEVVFVGGDVVVVMFEFV